MDSANVAMALDVLRPRFAVRRRRAFPNALDEVEGVMTGCMADHCQNVDRCRDIGLCAVMLEEKNAQLHQLTANIPGPPALCECPHVNFCEEAGKCSPDSLEGTLRKLARQVKLDTIEACAKVAERNKHASIMPGHVGKTIADEIRYLATESGAAAMEST